MKAKASFLILFLCFSACQISLTQNEEEISTGLNRIEKVNKNQIRNELLSFKDAALIETKEEINYSVTLNDSNNSCDGIMTADLIDDIEAATNYSIKYIKKADLLFINKASTFKYSGCSFINLREDVDVRCDFDGIIATSEVLKGANNVYDDGSPSGVTLPSEAYELMDISIKIASLDDVINGIGYSLAKPPSILEDGIIKYAFYKAKMDRIYSSYNHNIKLQQPTGFIIDQGNRGDWEFGISYDFNTEEFKYPGSLKDNGCGVIAMYNLLYDCGAKPSLPAVIALTQLCNADLALGFFGVNPIGDRTRDLIAKSLTLSYDLRIHPFIQSIQDDLVELTYNIYLSLMPWWLVKIMEEFSPGVLEYTKNRIHDAIEFAMSPKKAIIDFIDEYLSNLSDFTDIIELLIDEDDYECIECANYTKFSDKLQLNVQGIITFWNGNPFLSSAHTVYTKRIDEEIVELYNCGKEGIEVLDDFPYSMPMPDTEDQFIYGYVWKRLV